MGVSGGWTVLLASVGTNAVEHALTEYRQAPAWWLIVGVSTIPPATLGAVIQLVGRSDASPPGVVPPGDLLAEDTGRDLATDLPEELGRRLLARELGATDHQARAVLVRRPGAPGE